MAGDPLVWDHLFRAAWDEFIELQVMDKEAWVRQTLSTLADLDRFEIGLYVDDKPVGGTVLAMTEDIHIGECISVVAQYVLPQYRNKGISLRCMRECIRLSRELGHSHIAFTHRVGDWRYETIYRKL